ncbi:glutathione S-transferase [Neptunomonas sp.]|uniref:glutathione S-transferase n=1 Tax=Neptunomonas sp. TaxID=1971898 RepID=UPI0025D66099|nr:glutathione S-transferase [Neptunomonas sp.]
MPISHDVTTLPILYSFRRCPYAMRARLAITNSKINVELREVILKDKPAALLALSPKGTVPVLQLVEGQVLEESIDIMYWALQHHDPDQWLPPLLIESIKALIQENDDEFKFWLDRYKYADRHPEHSSEFYRTHCECWFVKLENLLVTNKGFLLADHYTLADMALFPFVRQCAHVDREWFLQTPYIHLQAWLDTLIGSPLFTTVMQKHPQWKEIHV